MTVVIRVMTIADRIAAAWRAGALPNVLRAFDSGSDRPMAFLKKPKFARLRTDLTADQIADVDDRLRRGATAAEVADVVHSWGHFTDTSKPSLTRYLSRYDRDHIRPTMKDTSFTLPSQTRVDILSVMAENVRRQERATIKAEANNSPTARSERLALGKLALDLFNSYVEVGILPRAPQTHDGTLSIDLLEHRPDPNVISFRLTPEALDAGQALDALDALPTVIPANGVPRRP
jgi:hypothetical protein